MTTLYTSLENWYKTTWELSYECKYSLSEINELVPFERDLYVDMIIQKQEENAKRLKSSG